MHINISIHLEILLQNLRQFLLALRLQNPLRRVSINIALTYS